MSNQSALAMADAILTCMPEPQEWRSHSASSELLDERVRSIVFDRGALAPLAPLVTASLVQMAAESLDGLGAEEIVALWREAVLDSCETYAREPEGWTDDEVVLFELRVARCFGIEDDQVHALVRKFHEMPEGTRFGVFLMIEKSPSFSWMSEAIDSFTRDVGVEAPPAAFRRLLRSLDSSH